MKLAYQRLIAHIILIVSSIILILILPVHNLITINAAIITTTMTHRLYWEIRLKESPHLKDWSVSLIKLIFWVSIFYILYVIAGALGLWGFLLLTLAVAAWKIYQGKELFNTYTNWAADRVWGRTKEDFDLEEALIPNEQSRSTTIIREDTQRASRQGEGVEENAVGGISVEQHISASETKLQEVPRSDIKPRKSRVRSTQGKAVRVMSKNLRSREQVN